MHGEKRITYWVLVRKTEVMRARGRSKRRWEDIFRWILEESNEVIWAGLTWLMVGVTGWLL
jgi:hypothetical protein